MINVISLYQDAARDDANKNENGDLTYAQFNRLLYRAEIDLLKFLTGDLIPSHDLPMPFNTQKNKDYLKRFIVKYPANNDFEIPENYYTWDALYKIGSYKVADCETDEITQVDSCNIPIPILDGGAFYNRCRSYIKSIRPSAQKPIAKIVDNRIEMSPKDVGSVCLEYIRYPKFGKIEIIHDDVFNQDVADPNTSVNLEWDEWAREPIIWFIVNRFATHTREKAAKENSMVDKPKG